MCIALIVTLCIFQSCDQNNVGNGDKYGCKDGRGQTHSLVWSKGLLPLELKSNILGDEGISQNGTIYVITIMDPSNVFTQLGVKL